MRRVNTYSPNWRALALCLSVLLTLFVTACGDDEENPCAGVTCERGVCSAGQCINSASCGGEDDNCLDGYTCNDADVCEERIACEDDSVCGGGLCENGACVNPPKCAVDDNCVPGDICIDEVCAPDPCGGCDRGICDVDSATCVDSDVCTSANEDEVCLDGSKCVQQSCQTEEEFCNALDCGGRGVCSFEEEACVNAADCGGDDEQCLEGFYCGDDNTCAENNCAGQNECTMGVCDRASGDCVNADPCTSAAECTDGFVCIDDACVTNEEACDPACTGNQECVYDSGSLSATCEESPQGCTSALDCTGERVCELGACAEPSACAPDDLEPNDDAADATVFADVETNSRISDASICSGDTDLFTFDTTNDPDGVGTLIADVSIENVDVGLGVLDVEIINSAGTVVASGSTEDNGLPTQSVAVEYEIDGSNGGVYTISVTDSGDVTTAGVSYSLSVDVVDPALIDACGTAEEFEIGTPFVGTTVNATSTALTSSCGDADGSLDEVVHTLEVNDPKYVTFQLVPSPGADLSISVRGACADATTELSGGCADDAGDGGVESISVGLQPGIYTVLVQAAGSGTGGSYTINATEEPIVCTDADNNCADATDLNQCNEFGTAFETVTCDFGCDMGECQPPPGDTCADATFVDASTPFSGVIDLSQYIPPTGGLASDPDGSHYDPAGTCGDIPSSDTEGPDYVWSVELAAGESVRASINDVGNGFDDHSLYMVTDCTALDQCVAFSGNPGNAVPEQADYANTSGGPETIFIILDTDETVSDYSSVQADVEVFQQTCVPGNVRCVLNRESQTCNTLGTAYDSSVVCTNGCAADNTCNPASNDSCDTPKPLVDGRTLTESLSLGTNTETARGSCGGIGSGADNDVELFYEVTTTAANSTVTVTVDPLDLGNDFDPIIWEVDGCTAGAAGSCLDGVDSAGNLGTETYEFFAATAGTFLIAVESYDEDDVNGDFEISVDIAEPACTPGTTQPSCDSTGTALVTCGTDYQFETSTCPSGQCTVDGSGVASCVGEPTGDTCADAIPLDRGTVNTQQTVSGTQDSSTADDLGPDTEGFYGECYFDAANETPDDSEVVYAIDLLASEVLTASVDTSDSDVRFYLQTSCGDDSTCYGNQTNIGSHTINYLSPSAQTVYLVVDSASIFSDQNFDLTYEIKTGLVCAPDTRRCDAGGTNIEFCDSSGLVLSSYACASGCANNACIDDPATMTACSTAYNLGSTSGGVSVGATFAIDQTQYTDDAAPSCDPEDGDGEEAFVSMDLQANDIIRFEAYSGFDFSDEATFYVFTDCSDIDGTCEFATSGTEVDDNYQVPTAGTYYVALDREWGGSSFEDETYYYSVEAGPPECQPNGFLGCSADGLALESCVGGIIDRYECDGGCQNDACVNPTGDVCLDAFRLDAAAGSGSESGSWAGSNGDYDLGSGQNGHCIMNEFDDGSGLDVVYAVDLNAGDVFEATLSSDEGDAVLALYSGECSLNNCVANDFRVDDETIDREISYLAPTTDTYYVIVDQDGTASASFTLDWEISTGLACAPNESRCIDATNVGVCNSDGSAETSYACPNGCADGFCAFDASTNNSCSSASTITDGFYGVFAQTDFTDDADLDSADCSGDDTPGGEGFLTVDIPANGIVRAKMRNTYDFDDISVYFITDCADAAMSCLAGGSATSSGFNEVVVEYQAGAAAETVKVVFDTDSTFDDSPNFIEIERLQPCDATTFTPSCNTDSSGYFYCSDGGFVAEYQCTDFDGNGISCDATTGRCDQPSGESCREPLVLVPDATGVATATNVLGAFEADYSFQTGNICTGSFTRGGDAVYAVDLTAGQVVTANLISTETPTEDLALYLATGCEGLPASCVGDNPTGSAGVVGSDSYGAGDTTPESVTYTSTTGGTVYIFVDSFFEQTFGGYSLDINVQ